MSIRGVDRVILGVEEMDAAQRFLRDFGLSEIERGEHGATFEALDGTNLVLRGRCGALKSTRWFAFRCGGRPTTLISAGLAS